MEEERIELTPENFCYLSRCQFFIDDIESTGCKLDYMAEKMPSEECACPLEFERKMRSDDPNWEPTRKRVIQKLRDLTDSFRHDREMVEEMGAEAYSDAVDKCAKLSQSVYRAKIKHDRLLYELQELRTKLFGQFETKESNQ